LKHLLDCAAGRSPASRVFSPSGFESNDFVRLRLVIGGINVLISAGFGYYLMDLRHLKEMPESGISAYRQKEGG
jgi:hypothetical protein